MKSIWRGAISFGLVNIPVKLYSALGQDTIDLDMLAKQDHSPIRYARIATTDGREVDYKDIVKGYEIEKGKYIILDDVDFKKINGSKNNLIEIENFVLSDEIDTIYFEKSYYLEPEKSSEKSYALLREALKKSKRVGVAKFILKNREHLGAIKIFENVIILNQLRYHSAIRKTDELQLPGNEKVTTKEIEMGIKLIEQLSEKFNPVQYKDDYHSQLKKIIDAKSKGRAIEIIKEEEVHPTHSKDLMSVLKASLESVKGEAAKDRAPVSAIRTINKRKTKALERK